MERAIIYYAKTGLEATDHFVPKLLEKYCQDNGYEIVAMLSEPASTEGVSFPMKYAIIGLNMEEDVNTIITLSRGIDFMTAEEYRALLDTDFSDVKINEMPDMASYHADLNDTIEKRQQKFIRKVGNPYMMRVGKMKVKVSFANNGVSIEEAFKNMLLTV